MVCYPFVHCSVLSCALFQYLLFSCCALVIFHSIHFALFKYYSFFMLHLFHAEFFSCCTFFILNFFHVALFHIAFFLVLPISSLTLVVLPKALRDQFSPFVYKVINKNTKNISSFQTLLRIQMLK